MTEHHDGDQRRELPPQIGAGEAERDGETERVRTGNHENRDHPLDHKRRVLSRERPTHERNSSGGNRDDGEKESGTVGERLRT